jgi:hypothetical protein
MTVYSIPTTYNGVTYRSALEADWAATFDQWEIYYEYEPQPYRLPSGTEYTCDFYLPNLHTYAEAKGPHNQRRWKPTEFAAVLAGDNFPDAYMVVVLRSAGPGGIAAWEPADTSEPFPVVVDCVECQLFAFAHVDTHGNTTCRRCGNQTHYARRYRSALDPLLSVADETLQMFRVKRGRAA